MLDGESLAAIHKMIPVNKVVVSLRKLEKEYKMAFWDGQEISKEEVTNLRWVNTNWFERIKFFIQGRPIYKMKSMYYNNEFYTTKAIDNAVEQINVNSIVVIKEEFVQKKYHDTWTRYLIIDETYVTALRMML